jgi:cyanate permease
MLAVAQFIGAFAATFQSGADEALLFESMQGLGREEEYAKISARAGAVTTVSAMLAGLAVGVIASVDILLPVFLTSAFSALTLIPIIMMKETVAVSPPGDRSQPRYMQIVRQGFSALRSHATLRWSAVYMIVLSSVSFYAFTFLQPFTIDLGLSIAMLGPVMVTVQLMAIAGSLSVPLVQRLLGNRAILLGVPLLIVPSLILVSFFRAVPVLLLVAFASFLFSLAQPVLLAVIQRRVSNSVRATFLSIQSLLGTVFLILTEPALGILADLRGVQLTYLAMAALLIIFCFPLLWIGRRWEFA